MPLSVKSEVWSFVYLGTVPTVWYSLLAFYCRTYSIGLVYCML